ncbi:hypothetical protein Rhe02_90440 [Rhizocola hellebori]|uniref:Uncharacterized protein n=1 Tax=Rhizocola hellebori TaxID=1392758 RepID=A0A8J3VLS2_9ACTN|nr:hypothetical protein [Rhizocola hellebori]GIH10977.1 hypothetical protein Rhe02_90440 [Rhizocola hellebori]
MLRALRVNVALVVSLTLALALTGCASDQPLWSAQPTANQSGSAGPSGSAEASPSAAASATPGLGQGGCDGFPADNVWRAEVASLPVHRSSAAFIASIGAASTMHPDFGAGLWEGAPIGIPVTTVKPGQATVKVTFQYARESDAGPYPVPAGVAIEGGPTSSGDRHIILHDPAACRLYELFAAYPTGNGGWKAGSGAIFDLRSNKLRPAGWTSADAAGLPIWAGLVRYPEMAKGKIDHALRITVPRTRNAYVWPARHAASDSTDAALPPMGLRLRLKAGVDTSKLPQQARVIAEAMKRYGVIIADNGSPWYLSGAPDDRWSNDALRALKQLRGSDFEAVDTSAMMASADSAAVR